MNAKRLQRLLDIRMKPKMSREVVEQYDFLLHIEALTADDAAANLERVQADLEQIGYIVVRVPGETKKTYVTNPPTESVVIRAGAFLPESEASDE